MLVVCGFIYMLPCALFVDHGHYQFNQVMHGFVLAAIACMLWGYLIPAVFFMVLAVCFK
jgi:uncharacterized membrane protein